MAPAPTRTPGSNPSVGRRSAGEVKLEGGSISAARQGRREIRYDMMIQGGRVDDPSLGLSAVRDVAIIRGKLALVAPDIPRSDARQVINARGRKLQPFVTIKGGKTYGSVNV
jgi:hypothetical protein